MLLERGVVVEVDLSKAHHFLLIRSKKWDLTQVTCVDCDDTWTTVYLGDPFLDRALAGMGDGQLLSVIDVDGR